MRLFPWHPDLNSIPSQFRYKTLLFVDYVSGAKSCIETIAVYAAKQEEQMEKKSYLRSFERFIQQLMNFEYLNIHFHSEHEVLDKSRPRVMDPVNPYNNLANNWDRRSIELVKQYARETKRRLDYLACICAARMDQLFEPQPVFRPDIGEIFPSDSNWLVSTTTTVSSYPDLKIRNEQFRKDHKLSTGLEILKIYFQSAICTARASGLDVSQIQETVINTINKQVFNKECTWSAAENKKHEDYDVTFTIPSTSGNAMRISYRL